MADYSYRSQPLTEEQRQRLKQWYNNHSGRPDDGAVGRRKLLNLTKPTRKKSAWQAYQSLYYSRKLKPIVESVYQEYKSWLADGEVAVSELAFRNRKCQELLGLESEEVKAEVEKAWLVNGSLETEDGETGSADDVQVTELKAMQT